MSKYNNILNLFSLTLVLVILFIVMYGCQFRAHRKKRIERFENSAVDDKDKDNQDEYENDHIEDKKNKDEDIKIDINDDASDELKQGFEDKPITRPLSDNEAKLLENFINEKFTDAEIDKLILNGEFKRENLENMIKYIENLSIKK